jgi:hypothetical protein
MHEELAMPRLLDMPITFGLDTKAKRQQWLKETPSKKRDALEDTDAYTLYRTGTEEGYLFAVAKDNEDLVYMVRYKRNVISKKYIGVASITQVALWANVAHPASIQLAKHVVFDILPTLSNSIISDSVQSDDGKKFWKRILSMADSKGLTYGLIEGGANTKHRPTSEENSSEFFERIETTVYGKTSKHERFRFFIRFV